MGSFFSDLWTQIKGIWARLDSGQRLTVGTVTASAVIGLIAIIWFAGQPDYVTVYTAQNSEDVKSAEKALTSGGISFKASGDGRSFDVEAGSAAAARQALASSGLAGDSGGSEPTLQTNALSDRATRRYALDKTRVKAAEATIRAMEGVRNVKITASPPRQGSFVTREQARRPGGTVVLELKNGVDFRSTARAAANALATAIELSPENVTVINSRTRQIYSGGTEGGGSDTNLHEFEQWQRSISREREILALNTLGIYEGKARVSVNVELDPLFEMRTEKILPDEPLITQQETTTDSTESGRGGDPSAASLTAPTRGPSSKTQRDTTKTSYMGAIGERRVGRYAPPIKRMTCALTLHTELEDRRTEIEAAVKAAIGWDDSRDNQTGFSVLVSDFDPALDVGDEIGPGLMDYVREYSPMGMQAIGLVLVLLFLKSLLKRAKPREQQLALDAMPLPPPEEDEDLSSDQVARRMRREIERAISDDPAAVSKLLESWLAEVKP